jgi:hypothetical protein
MFNKIIHTDCSDIADLSHVTVQFSNLTAYLSYSLDGKSIGISLVVIHDESKEIVLSRFTKVKNDLDSKTLRNKGLSMIGNFLAEYIQEYFEAREFQIRTGI